jgi:Leucine-rich repeat (LRR) protein
VGVLGWVERGGLKVPSDISRLTALQRLVLAGNPLTRLPDELFGLTTLEGLWVHGNMLQELPEQLGQLTKLKQLSLAGGWVGWQKGV